VIKYDGVKSENDLRRQRVALAARMLDDNDCHTGISGHIAVRSSRAGHILATPRLYWDVMLPDDICEYGPEADQDVDSSNQHARASAILEARPDVECVVHLHSHAAVSFATASTELQNFYNVATLFADEVTLLPWESPGTPADYASTLGQNKVMILPNHGIMLASDSLEHATIESIMFEQAAEFQLVGEARGADVMPHDRVARQKAALMPYRDDMWNANIRRMERVDRHRALFL
jgi:L-fuculose-phosphate aldolase